MKTALATKTHKPFAKVLKSTDLHQRSMLRDAGFVHITGLRITRSPVLGEPYVGFDLEAAALGTYWQEDGASVIVTEGGEVWISRIAETKANEKNILGAIHEVFCPRGENDDAQTNVDLSYDSEENLLRRMADPDYVPTYRDA
jgi:hypothetical protein